MKKKYAGYINLKTLNGVLYPSSIQNIIMKNYIENNLKGIFYLSPTEVLQSKFPITLNTLISKETKVSGIVMLSTFFLPKNLLIIWFAVVFIMIIQFIIFKTCVLTQLEKRKKDKVMFYDETQFQFVEKIIIKDLNTTFKDSVIINLNDTQLIIDNNKLKFAGYISLDFIDVNNFYAHYQINRNYRKNIKKII